MANVIGRRRIQVFQTRYELTEVPDKYRLGVSLVAERGNNFVYFRTQNGDLLKFFLSRVERESKDGENFNISGYASVNNGIPKSATGYFNTQRGGHIIIFEN